MYRYSLVVLCAVLVLTNLAFTNAGKFGGGSGGRSGGYSGGRGGGHHYPSSGGLSGSGRGGGGGHNYPASTGLSGTGRGGYPSNQGNSYPPARGNQNAGHGYPPSSGGSGSNTHYQGGRVNNAGGTTNIHHHYHYSPPQQIHYASPHGGPAMNYPVYRGTPPTYVYQYKDSGSKYGTLLAGLALFNLGALAGGVYGHSHSHSQNYVPKKGEVCMFGVKKDNGDYEETRIDCTLITSFIYQDEAAAANRPAATNTSVVTTTTTNTTVVNMTNPAPDAPQPPGAVNVNVSFTMLPNGTLVPVDVSTNGTTVAPPAPAGGASSSVITTTTTNTTVVSALDVKGAPVSVTPGMTCYVIRKIGYTSIMKKTVPCGLLQTYADKSLKRNSAARNVPAFTILAVMCAAFYVY